MTLLTKLSAVQADSVQRERSKIMYKINPSSYSSVFVIPTQIADRHLRLAGKAQLKVLLWLYRNPSVTADIDIISKDTGIPKDEIDDAMLYWIEAGLVMKDGEAPVQIQTEAPSYSATENARLQAVTSVPVREKKAEEKPVVADEKKEKPVIVKPSIKDISMRISESPDIRSMFAEAQEAFGRTLGYDGQASLIILHDHYSLPPEVIIMLCNYARTIGKQGSLAYIMKMGATWSECGITDFESASNKIARMENAQNVWDDFRRLTGVENPKPTQKQAEYLEIWINDFAFDMDMIYYSYEKTVEKKGKLNWGYMNGILRSWRDSGHKTVDDVEKAGREYSEGVKAQSTASKSETKPSYDVEKAVIKSRKIDPNKTKRGQ